VPVLTLSAVTGFEYDGTRIKLTSVPTQKDGHYWLKENDLLITRSNTPELVGHVAMYDGNPARAICCDLIMKMQVDSRKALTRYLYYYLRSPEAREYLTSRAQGASSTMKKIGKQVVQDIPVPLPSLPEQRRIVAILDEAFEGIAIAKANTETNLQNARGVFDSYMDFIFSQGGSTWVGTTIGQIIQFIDYRGKTPVKTEDGVRLITAKNVKMGFLREEPMEFIASADYEGWMTRGIPRQGDVLFTTEAPLGNVAQLDTDERVAFAQRIIIMQPDYSKLDCTFLKYLLLSRPVQQRIHAKGTGATVKGIKASLLRTIQITYPRSLPEQNRITDRLDEVYDETLHSESIFRQKIASLNELKHSLLHRAFNGNL
jgi:type I restriction enzyme S subunit